ncbi:MAG: OmpH family outer membrane protein [Schwartzia sp.]|nr:OmpH family outer membrane protein [Schwartzia sp. (in: firmicutes)]
MTVKKKILVAGIALLTAVLASGCAGERKASIAYFNADRIDQEAPQIKAIEEEAAKKMEELQKEVIDLLMKQGEMTPEEFQQAQQEQMIKMQTAGQQYQMQIRQKVDVALDEICKEKKIDAVLQNSSLEKSVILGGIDLTDDLIEKLK